MYEPYDEDDEYDEDYYNYDYGDQYDPYKFYFKFDVGPNSSLSDWFGKMVNQWFNIDQESLDKLSWYQLPQNDLGFPVVSFPVNSWNSNTEKGNSFQYLGSNYQGSPIWKKKYLIKDQVNILYKNHILQHSIHFLKQPTYYKGMFDILN